MQTSVGIAMNNNSNKQICENKSGCKKCNDRKKCKVGNTVMDVLLKRGK